MCYLYLRPPLLRCRHLRDQTVNRPPALLTENGPAIKKLWTISQARIIIMFWNVPMIWFMNRDLKSRNQMIHMSKHSVRMELFAVLKWNCFILTLMMMAMVILIIQLHTLAFWHPVVRSKASSAYHQQWNRPPKNRIDSVSSFSKPPVENWEMQSYFQWWHSNAFGRGHIVEIYFLLGEK